MKIGKLGKVVFNLLLTLSLVTSFSYQTIAQSKKLSPTQFTNFDQSITFTKLNEKVWVHTSYNEWNGTIYDHNGLIVLTSKGAILIDTAWDSGGNYQKTEELLRMIKRHFKKRVDLALITHAHDDSIGGIQALLNQGIDVRSTKLTAKLAEKYGYPPPRPTLDIKPMIKVGDTVIEAYYPGEGHSQDNITVWLPQHKILFGGCLIKSLDATDLGNTADANIEQWGPSVKKVIRKYPNVKTVIPGHESWGDKKLLFHTLYLIKKHRQFIPSTKDKELG